MKVDDVMSKLMKIIGAVALINIVARVFGFLREVAVANQYGTTTLADAVSTAYTIPNFIYLVVGGALTTAFISVYHSTRLEKELYIRKVFTIVLVTAVAITLLLLLFTDPLLQLFFKDLKGHELTVTRNLFLWMMPSTIFLVLSTWMSGLLNVNGKFTLSSVSILIYNGSFLFIAVFFTKFLGVESYGVGAFFGAIFMGGFLYAGIRKSNLHALRPSFGLTDDTKRLWMIALPIMFGGASLQFYFIMHRVIAAGLGEGAISSVNFASKLTSFPQAIMMTAVTTVIYPLLSKKESEGDLASIRGLYRKGLGYLAILLIPAAIIAYFFADPIVRLVFGHGKFTEESILITVPLLQAFAFSMFFLAANTYMTRFYYAKGQSLMPVLFSIVSVFGINLAVVYLFIDAYGTLAIAYGTVISAAFNFIFLALYAKWKWEL